MGVQNFEFQCVFFLFLFFFGGGGGGVWGGGGFRKIKKILGCEHFVDIFFEGGGHHKIGPNLRLSSIYFSVFCNLNVQNGDIFWGCKYF